VRGSAEVTKYHLDFLFFFTLIDLVREVCYMYMASCEAHLHCQLPVSGTQSACCTGCGLAMLPCALPFVALFCLCCSSLHFLLR
jgi:hypothetical protein